jgi:hypothetical protein
VGKALLLIVPQKSQYIFYEDGKEVIRVDTEVPSPAWEKSELNVDAYFEPPTFGITVRIGAFGTALGPHIWDKDISDLGCGNGQFFGIRQTTMGMQVLGASHGFDPGASTSGFVLWINGRGVMVDPPLNSGDLLRKAGVQHA